MTTEDIAWKYRVARVADGARDKSAQEEFYGWLFELIRSEREQAWDEAEGAFETAHNADMLEPWPYIRGNPYRK